MIYKLESFNLFDQLLVRISEEIVSFLNIGKLPVAEETEVKEAQLPESDAKKLQTGRQEMGRGRQMAPGKPANEPFRAEKKSDAMTRVHAEAVKNIKTVTVEPTPNNEARHTFGYF